MKTPPIRHSIALASTLILAAGAQAQEAGAWEMRGPPAAASSVSREQVVSVVMWARAQGWRPASEASRFDDEVRSSDLRRTARATHTRAAVVAELREARKAHMLEGDDGEAGATERALRERQAHQERERERLLAQADRPLMTAAAAPRILPPAGALGSGTEAAALAVASPVAATLGSVEDRTEPPRDGSGRLPDDSPQAPLAPGREVAITSPVRPSLADGGDAPAPSETAGSREAALPPESPAASSAEGQPEAAAVATPVGTGSVAVPADAQAPAAQAAPVAATAEPSAVDPGAAGSPTSPSSPALTETPAADAPAVGEAASTQPVEPPPAMQASDLAPQNR